MKEYKWHRLLNYGRITYVFDCIECIEADADHEGRYMNRKRLYNLIYRVFRVLLHF